MAPSENEPLPRTIVMGGAVDTATPDPTAGKGIIARPPEGGQSDDATNNQRPPGAADTETTVVATSRPFNAVGPSRVWIADPSLHHIVIVGGGAAGLELATKLGDSLGRRRAAQITLVERTRTHIWKPHLHEVAAGTMDVGRDAVDYLAQASDHHFRYRIGEMIGLNRAQHEVYLAASFDAEGHEMLNRREFVGAAFASAFAFALASAAAFAFA